MPRLLFVDTSAWYAAFDRKDAHHAQVEAALRQARASERRLVTSTDVLGETLTLIRARAGHALALRAGEAVWHSGAAEILDVDGAARLIAWEIFSRFSEHTLSFTDCTSAALMRTGGIDDVLTLDRHFTVLGFNRLPAT